MQEKILFVRSIDSLYHKLEKIGEGTYGEVWKAVDKLTRSRTVALKKIKLENYDFPISTVREIAALKKLKHQNIISLVDVLPEGKVDLNNRYTKFYLVFEYCEHDFTGLVHSPQITFSIGEIKCYMIQLLDAMAHAHDNNILHRDIKCANILLNNYGVLKLADFGLSRDVSNKTRNGKMTNEVITVWYRPPELLFGADRYNAAVDMWSIGCVFAEIFMKKVLFPGFNEMDQISKIFELCGTPNQNNWDSIRFLPLFNTMKPRFTKNRTLKSFLSSFNIPADALDLIDGLLQLDPQKRLTAHQAMAHPFFTNFPLPIHPDCLPRYNGSFNDMKIKKEGQRKQRKRRRDQFKYQHNDNITNNTSFNINNEANNNVNNVTDNNGFVENNGQINAACECHQCLKMPPRSNKKQRLYTQQPLPPQQKLPPPSYQPQGLQTQQPYLSFNADNYNYNNYNYNNGFSSSNNNNNNANANNNNMEGIALPFPNSVSLPPLPMLASAMGYPPLSMPLAKSSGAMNFPITSAPYNQPYPNLFIPPFTQYTQLQPQPQLRLQPQLQPVQREVPVIDLTQSSTPPNQENLFPVFWQPPQPFQLSQQQQPFQQVNRNMIPTSDGSLNLQEGYHTNNRRLSLPIQQVGDMVGQQQMLKYPPRKVTSLFV